MNLENTKAQMKKGVLEYCILKILLHKEALSFGHHTRNEGSQADVGRGDALPPSY
jgi:hypothetical protein